MLSVDYKITFQDDLDSEETSNEYSFDRPGVKWGVICGFSIFIGLFCLYCIVAGIIKRTDSDANVIIGEGIIAIILGIIFPLLMQPKMAQSALSRRSMQKRWSKKPSQEEVRNITLTETEVIFKTEYSETAWTWKAFKGFFEGNKSFILWFFSGEVIYVPKRIFTEPEAINKFKNILKQHN